MSSTVTIRGADRLTATTRRAARELTQLAQVNAAAADAVRAAAHPPHRTGRLAASLTTASTATEGEVSSSAPYAGVIEHGWGRHNIAPTHFLTRAFESREAASLELYAVAVDRALARIKGV